MTVELCSAENEFPAVNSPGRLSDEERICRGAYDPKHKGAEGPRAAFAPESHIFRGQLSVWRINGEIPFTREQAIAHMQSDLPEGNSLWRVFAPSVGEVRSLGESECRGYFCVIDDTDTGNGAHPAHASIKFCDSIKRLWSTIDDAREDGLFRQAIDELRLLMKRKCIWPSGI